MKNKVLLLGAVAAAFAVTTFAASPLLSPRAAGNQTKIVQAPAEAAAVPVVAAATLSPRAQGNQIATVASGNADVNPVLGCKKTMAGTPKMVAECASHTTMPGCAKLAMDK